MSVQELTPDIHVWGVCQSGRSMMIFPCLCGCLGNLPGGLLIISEGTFDDFVNDAWLWLSCAPVRCGLIWI